MANRTSALSTNIRVARDSSRTANFIQVLPPRSTSVPSRIIP